MYAALHITNLFMNRFNKTESVIFIPLVCCSLPHYPFSQNRIIDHSQSIWFKYEPQRETGTFWNVCPNEDFDQPALSRSLIKVFIFRMKKLCILGYPKCDQWRFWSHWANAQANLNLRWAHMSDGTFSDLRLIGNKNSNPIFTSQTCTKGQSEYNGK